MTLQDMTTKQVDRLYRRVWARMTDGDGYQPFGYDRRTLALTRPTWLALIDTVHAEVVRRERELCRRRPSLFHPRVSRSIAENPW